MHARAPLPYMPNSAMQHPSSDWFQANWFQLYPIKVLAGEQLPGDYYML